MVLFIKKQMRLSFKKHFRVTSSAVKDIKTASPISDLN